MSTATQEEYTITKDGEYMRFVRDHGNCYGHDHTTTIDCGEKKGRALYKHIKIYGGEWLAKSARKQGYC